MYKQYVNDIYRYLYSLTFDHYLTEDLLQETFYRAFLHLQKFEIDDIKPWLFRVAHNLCIDHFRKHKRVTVTGDEKFSHLKSNINIEETVLRNETLNQIIAFIETLPDKQKQAILLSDVSDLTYEQSANIMGVSLANFKSSLFRGRQKIRKWEKGNRGDHT
ncbi:sigma-70 family RNA polymerase sigma factor [Virgibacillus natechei]|nr:sigma-70 family RNA polymerase sigma factor [Virgibacillus natechei]